MILRLVLLLWYKLKTYCAWKRTQISGEIQNQYVKYEPQIKAAYNQVTHWHGTGRYHYQVEGKSKYDQKINPNILDDVLAQVIKVGGIQPFDDPWVQTNYTFSSSISTTQWKAYARIYAELHSTKETAPKITFANRLDVIRFFLYYTFANVPFFGLYKIYIAGYVDKRFKTKGPVWSSTINNSIQSKGNSYTDLIDICGRVNSNIKGNYGILFGINGKDFKHAHVNPLVSMFEDRFMEKIELNDLTHIEVVNEKVDEVKEILKKNKLNIPVLPLELCEIYVSKIPFKYHFNKEGKIPRVTALDYIRHYWRKKK